MYLMLAATIAVTANFYDPDPRLSAFSLKPVIQEDEPNPEPQLPSLYWRLMGWGQYIACGAVSPSVEYRQDRSNWDAPIDNPALRSAAWIGAAQGVNMVSDMMRKEDAGTSAWMLRAGTLTACVWSAAWNFNRGFFHR